MIMASQIPLPYQIYLNKITLHSYDGRILTEVFKKILGFYFRIPKDKIHAIMHEMYELNLIRMCNHKYIWVLR
jgi:hypothetical protein